MAEKNKTIVTLVSVTVLIILAIAFLSSIADTTLGTTEKLKIADESFNLNTACYVGGQVNESDSDCNRTVTNAPTSWKQEDSDCYLSGVVVTNATGTALTLNTDYRVYSSTGVIQFLNTTATETTALVSNVTLIDYSYCGNNYMADSWGRSILNTNVGLFAIAILVAIVLVVYLLLEKKKDED